MATKAPPPNAGLPPKNAKNDSRPGSAQAPGKITATPIADDSQKGSSKPELTLSIKVLSAKNIKGSKGDKSSTIVRIQFADFDYKDSPVVNDTATPEFNFTYDQVYNLDETLIDLFANGRVSFSVFESLPKDKTNLLGVAEINLYSKFLKPTQEPKLSIRETLPVVYANTKLLGTGTETPEIDIQISISRPFDLESGVFASLRVEDVFPVPDEWTLKDGTEKDLNSSMQSIGES